MKKQVILKESEYNSLKLIIDNNISMLNNILGALDYESPVGSDAHRARQYAKIALEGSKKAQEYFF